MALQIVRGIPMWKELDKQKIEEALDYKPRDDDVIIASYPRTGTILLSYIVQQILTKGESFPVSTDIFYKVIPFSFAVGAAVLDAMTAKPRVYKHHFAMDKVKYNPKTKIMYIYRRPDDNLISRYYLHKDMEDVIFDFDEYFERYLKGDISFGGYFDHISSYWKFKDSKNMLFVSYEYLIFNKKEETLKIAQFLGDKYYEDLVNDESILNKIMKNTDFQFMQKNIKIVIPDSVGKALNFFRKGKVGEGKLSLSEDQYQRLKDHAENKLKGTELLLGWYTKEC